MSAKLTTTTTTAGGYASESEREDEDFDADSGDSLSGSDIDDQREISRLSVRPASASQPDSAFRVVAPSRTRTNNKHSRKTKPSATAAQTVTRNNQVIQDFGTLVRRRAHEEMLYATGQKKASPTMNENAASTGPSPFPQQSKKEKIPDACKGAFSRPPKNAKPILVDIGPINVEEERKKHWAKKAAEHRLLHPSPTTRKHADPKDDAEAAAAVAAAKNKAAAEAAAMRPSQLSANLRDDAVELQKRHPHEDAVDAADGKDAKASAKTKAETQQQPEVELEQTGEDVAVDDDETSPERDKREFYAFLDHIVAHNEAPTQRPTFAEPFATTGGSDGGSAAALPTEMSEAEQKERELAMRAANARNTRMYTALAKLATGPTAGASSSSSNVASTMMTGVDDDDDSSIGNNEPKELAFQRARAFLEGMLLKDSFVDTVNNLLEKARPAFQFTKYTRLGGEFTLEQHRQWEVYCGAIETLVLKKLHTIMDIQEFFSRVFDHEDDDDEDTDSNSEDDPSSSSAPSSSLSHDAWELVLSVMKFEHFCSLIDSYIESCEEAEALASGESASSAASSPVETSTPTTTAAASASAIATAPAGAKPRATLFHALPRSSGGGGGGAGASSSASSVAGGGAAGASSTTTTTTTRSSRPLGQVQPRANAKK